MRVLIKLLILMLSALGIYLSYRYIDPVSPLLYYTIIIPCGAIVGVSFVGTLDDISEAFWERKYVLESKAMLDRLDNITGSDERSEDSEE